LFSRRWGIFRGTAEPPEVDPFAAAIVELNLRGLKELIGGREPKEIVIEPEKLPLDVLRWKGKKASLISVAAAVGGEPLRYLIGFHGQRLDAMTLPQAVAFGDPETIRMVWDRSDEKERVSNPALIRLAIDFHHVEVARWLLQEQPLWVDVGRLFARETRAFDVLTRLPKGSERLPTLDDVGRIEQNPTFNGTVADAVETKSTSWLAAALLVGGDPDGNTTPPLDGTVVCFAAKSGYEDGVRLLLRFGANPNRRLNRTNALSEGAAYPRIVALLLEKGANPNGGWAGDYSNPLVCAARAKNIESLRLLLSYGGDARRVDQSGDSVLHAALESTNAECCRELLVHGADPCGQSGFLVRETPMHVAAKYAREYDGPERVKILDLLFEAGASVLAVDARGCTPGQRARLNRRTSKDVLEWFARR
jgi:ankyrin repeat protein